MKKIFNIALSASMLLAGATACEDELDVVNPNYATTEEFGKTAADLEEVAIACYNRIRIEGTFARVGYLFEVVMGDEVNTYSDNDWWRAWDYLSIPQSNDVARWVFRDWYYTLNTCNYLLTYVDQVGLDTESDQYKQLKGQGLFLRGLAYYELACYFQDIPLITDYSTYTSLDGLYVPTASQSEVLDQVEADLSEAMTLLPSRDKGGEWANGRATCGAAAGYYARALMFRHKFDKALPVLKDIIAGKYGTYKLLADYGDNFRSTVENQEESLWEVQFLDYGVGGSDMEWTPVNNSKSSSQGQALETVFGNSTIAGWNDLASTPWLYQTFKSQKTTAGTVDPRLYWTLISYETDYNSMSGYANTAFTYDYTYHVTTGAHLGISVAKHTTARENLYSTIAAAGLSCGVNLRLMRYSDVLLRAAECENEINGPTQQAIDWINQVRNRAGLQSLELANFPSADALFEQIANVERPTEFGCEHGRFQDIIRWGWLYDAGRLAQLRKHGCTMWLEDVVADKYNELVAEYCEANNCKAKDLKEEVTAKLSAAAKEYAVSTYAGKVPNTVSEADDDPYSKWIAGHEYMPIYEGDMQANYNLVGNSANNSTSNIDFYEGYTIHPVVEGIGVQ